MIGRVLLLMAGICLWSLLTGLPGYAKPGVVPLKGDEADTADLLIAMIRIGRDIVSEHQGLINDATKGNKGFTDDVMGDKIRERFLAEAHIDLSRRIGDPQSEILLAMLQAEREVILDVQPALNKQGIGFKGFIPSAFARKAGQKFFARTGVRVKLTGTESRFPGNQPDDFEAEVLRMFADPRHPKGQRYAKVSVVNGKPAMRVMTPEYAEAACLVCHGSPKGEWDMMGMKKEGWTEGELAGAISVVMPLR